MKNNISKVNVLIIGSGPVGLSLALALARQGISSTIIERNPSIIKYPRARGVNVRTMELFTQWGEVEKLLKYEQPKEARRIIWLESFLGKEVRRVEVDDCGIEQISPANASFVSQDRVEEYLFNTLKEYKDVEINFSKEYLSFEETKEGLVVKILDIVTNQEQLILTKYLIAADGAHSIIREQLKIAMHGPGNLGKYCRMYCDMDISKWTQHRPCIGYFFTDPNLQGKLLASVDGKDLWMVSVKMNPEDTKDTFTDEYCINEIRKITGINDLQVEILNKGFWTMAAQVASSYSKGNVFLVGDAAHRLPPTGGFGMNTGIQDAHNLAWKLAYVIKYGVSGRLLDTYFDERMPIALQNVEWSSRNAARYAEASKAIHSKDDKKLADNLNDQTKNLNSIGLDIGFVYHSEGIFSENDDTLSSAIDNYIPTTLPGARAPYISLIKNGKNISIFDLFERDFVLLVGEGGDQWLKAAKDLSLPFKLQCYKIGVNGDFEDPQNIWKKLYEIEQEGAVLVRPDGHVAWRSKIAAEDIKQKLLEVLNKASFLS